MMYYLDRDGASSLVYFGVVRFIQNVACAFREA